MPGLLFIVREVIMTRQELIEAILLETFSKVRGTTQDFVTWNPLVPDQDGYTDSASSTRQALLRGIDSKAMRKHGKNFRKSSSGAAWRRFHGGILYQRAD